MITADLFYRMRFERGLKVSANKEFSNPRLKEIAVEQSELFDRLDALDAEIAKMNEREKNENPDTLL